MLLFSELAALTTPRLGQSEQWLRFSLNEATKTDFKKQVNELMTWPTSVGLDPRYVSFVVVREALHPNVPYCCH